MTAAIEPVADRLSATVRRYTVRINTQETLVVRMASQAGSAIRVGAAVAVSWDPMDARIL